MALHMTVHVQIKSAENATIPDAVMSNAYPDQEVIKT